MAEERKIPPPPPPRPNINGGSNGYNVGQANNSQQNVASDYNKQPYETAYVQSQTNQQAVETQNQVVSQVEGSVQQEKKEKKPLDPKVRRLLCIIGASVSFSVAVVCLVLLFVL